MKERKKYKRRKHDHHIRSMIFVLSFLIMMAAGISQTSAYLSTKTDSIKNSFQYASVSCKIHEEFDGNVKKNVKIQNTGSMDAFIRCALVINWKDEDGNVYWKKPVRNEDYEMSLDLGNGWSQHADGYYYWDSQVGSNAFTGILVNEIRELKTPEGTEPSVYHLNVEIMADAIQYIPTEAVENAWGVTISNGKVVH